MLAAHGRRRMMSIERNVSCVLILRFGWLSAKTEACIQFYRDQAISYVIYLTLPVFYTSKSTFDLPRQHDN